MENKISLFVVFLFFFSSCKKDEDGKTGFRGLIYPSNFPSPVYTMPDNPITEKKFLLGRKLFFDPILSRDNTISCGSCHIPSSAFSHHGHDLSHGIDDLLGKRNAPGLQNLLWQTSFFWDGGVHNIDMIPWNPIQNPVEMDETPSNIIQKLNQNTNYKQLFKEAFGSEQITSVTFVQALSQYQAMLISANSKYDQYKRNENGVSLSQDELEGLNLFNQKCSSCHATDLFTDNSFRNNGILNVFDIDKGRYEISLNNNDIGKFKVPSLRNVAKTKPYMHNGQYPTLQSVLDHYSSGVKDFETLDPILKQNGVLGIDLTEIEKQKIIAFLNTLTDEEFIRDPLFSEP